jgi:hypothetical protein
LHFSPPSPPEKDPSALWSDLRVKK